MADRLRRSSPSPAAPPDWQSRLPDAVREHRGRRGGNAVGGFGVTRPMKVRELGGVASLVLLGCAREPARATTPEAPLPADQGIIAVASSDIHVEGRAPPLFFPGRGPALVSERPSFFGRASGIQWQDETVEIVHSSLGDLCEDIVTGTPGASCQPAPVPFRFAGRAPYLGLRAVYIRDKDWRRHQLVLVTKEGVAALPVHWDVVSNVGTGCPSFVEPLGVESVRIERGLLVITTVGKTIQYVDVDEAKRATITEEQDPSGLERSGVRRALVRGLVIAKHDGTRLYTRALPPPLEGGLFLARKVAPHADLFPDFERVPWTDISEARVRDDGDLDLPEPPP